MSDTPPHASISPDSSKRLIAKALESAHIAYVCEPQAPGGPVFRLGNGVEIEVRRNDGDRSDGQSERAANVISAKGDDAVRYLAGLIARQAELETIIAEAYQVVGHLAAEAGLFETDDVERALDILCMDGEKKHDSMLPFAPELERKPST